MYRMRFSLLAAVAVCVAPTSLSTPRRAQAEPPETVEITLGLYVPYDGEWPPDPIPNPYYVGEDTVAIVTGNLFRRLGGLSFSESSPAVGEFDDADGQIDVAGTEWDYHGTATIVNVGGPTDAGVFARGMPWPPAHYPLLFFEIMEVHTSWMSMDPSSGNHKVQEFLNEYEYTTAVFIIVKGEFRVKP